MQSLLWNISKKLTNTNIGGAMTPSLKAVLARFNGDAAKARAYCVDIAARYPRLAVEYSMYFNLLGGAYVCASNAN